MSLAPGDQVAERYVVESRLGQGSFATVWAVRHAKLGSAHALKVLSAHLEGTARVRFLAEGRIQASLSHPNLVRVTDLVEVGPLLALVLDRVDGESLADHLARGRLPLRTAWDLGRQILEGVAAAHAAELVHRDLKPANVFVGRDGVARVSDFGLARASDTRFGGPRTEAGLGMGTPGYMAPEAYVDAASVDARADVFSLGCILFELVASLSAFPWPTPWLELYQRALEGRHRLDEAVVDPSLLEVIRAALEPSAARRPADAAELLALWRAAEPRRSAAPAIARTSLPRAPRQETRALLLIDLVDSTRLTERLGDVATASLWARHDRLARDLLVPHRGREIDKTDGFLLLFDRASDGATYAVAYHRALVPLEIAARAGLHVGQVVLTENSAEDVARGAKPLEVDGLAKPTAARVMSMARAGQTLLTVEAKEALGTTPLRVASHGHWRAKGLAEPFEVFEVGEASAPFAPPIDGAKVYRVVRTGDQWRPVMAVPHHLPAEGDAFVGRADDLRALADVIDGGARLVSVLGTGGTGKTRLVVRFAWTWLGDWPGGAWFCDLSEARSVDGIAAAVARGLDLPLGKDDPVAQLGHALAGRGRCLVILDNFEQVSRWASDTVGRWVERAPQASFLVTTREVLGLPGEAAVALPPLREAEAVDLFVARAKAAKHDFAMTPADRPHVEALVKLLDCLPLAIELAAARVRVMAPPVLLARMTERFKLLSSTGGRHTRQATLRATLDWSWNLLTPDERTALAQLSVFEGGFTLESAEAVLSLVEAWPVDVVQALVDKSLARRAGDGRFDLLVSVQEYAGEKLAEGGRDAVLARHGTYFATFGSESALGGLHGHGGAARLGALVPELDNLVAGCRRAVVRGDGEVAAAALGAAWVVLSHRGPFATAIDLAEQVLTLAGSDPPWRGAVERWAGQALLWAGRPVEARIHHEASLAWARRHGDRRAEGAALQKLARVDMHQGRAQESREHDEAAIAIAREVGDRVAEGAALASLGVTFKQLGRLGETRAHSEAALLINQEVGDRRSEGVVLGTLGRLAEEEGRPDDARTLYDAALVAARDADDRVFAAVVLGNLAMLNLRNGRADEARSQLEVALVVHREVGNRSLEGLVLSDLAAVHHSQGRKEDCRVVLEEALTVFRGAGPRRKEAETLGNLAVVLFELDRGDEALAAMDAALKVQREVGNRRAEGLLLCGLGRWHQDQGRTDEARAAFLAAEEALRSVGDGLGLGKLLSFRARLEHAAGRPDDARAALEAARVLVEATRASADSDLGRTFAESVAALSS